MNTKRWFLLATLTCFFGNIGFAETSPESALAILNKSTWTERAKSIRELYREFYYKKNQLLINDKGIKQKLVELLTQDELLKVNYIATLQKQGKTYAQAYYDSESKYPGVDFNEYITNLGLLVRIYKDPVTIPIMFEHPYNRSADFSNLAYIMFGKKIFGIVIDLAKNGSDRQKFEAYYVLNEWVWRTLERSDFSQDLRLDSNEINRVKGVFVEVLDGNKVDESNVASIGWGVSKIVIHEKDEAEKRKLKKRLIKLLKHNDLGIRKQAVEFLGKCGNEEDVQYLNELTPDNNSIKPVAESVKNIKAVDYPVQKEATDAIKKIRARLKGIKDAPVVFDPGAD